MGKTVTAIDVGAAPGDGTGTQARSCFQIVNQTITAIATGLFADVSGEIAAITEKTTPVNGDLALIEDSGASNAKKRLTLANLAAYVATIFKATANVFTKQQNFGSATLADDTTISWNLDNAQTAKVTLGGNRTLANPTNMVDGGTYVLRVLQDGTGSRTLAYGSAYKWPAGTAPTLTTTAGAVDIITFVSNGTSMFGVISKAFS